MQSGGNSGGQSLQCPASYHCLRNGTLAWAWISLAMGQRMSMPTKVCSPGLGYHGLLTPLLPLLLLANVFQASLTSGYCWPSSCCIADPSIKVSKLNNCQLLARSGSTFMWAIARIYGRVCTVCIQGLRQTQEIHATPHAKCIAASLCIDHEADHTSLPVLSACECACAHLW